MTALRAVSYGGGVQSTALLVLAARGEIDFPLFLHADVGHDSEAKGTIRYVREVAELGWVRWWAHGHGHGRGPTAESELEAWLRSTMCRRIEFCRASRGLVCPSCGASASLPLGVTCADHQPQEVWS